MGRRRRGTSPEVDDDVAVAVTVTVDAIWEMFPIARSSADQDLSSVDREERRGEERRKREQEGGEEEGEKCQDLSAGRSSTADIHRKIIQSLTSSLTYLPLPPT
jgi:hypothetical protein